MLIPLDQAPFDQPLILERIDNQNLAERLQRMGLFEQDRIIRLDEKLLVHSIRIRGPKGDATLGGGMGVKTIIHLEDDRKMPLSDMEPGETGHIEGITGGSALAHTLEVLGFRENDPITMVRKLPPMEYITVIEHGPRIRLSEGDAAKIWGTVNDKQLQYSLTPINRKFLVTEILGGKRAHKKIKNMGIKPSSVLILEGVEQTRSFHLSLVSAHLVITSRDGLHLHLPLHEGNNIWVSV